MACNHPRQSCIRFLRRKHWRGGKPYYILLIVGFKPIMETVEIVMKMAKLIVKANIIIVVVMLVIIFTTLTHKMQILIVIMIFRIVILITITT